MAFDTPSSFDKGELDCRLDICLYDSGGGGTDEGISAGVTYLIQLSVGEDSVDNVDMDGALLDVFPTERCVLGVVFGEGAAIICSTNGMLRA